jgi:hypothetical protein
MDTSKYPANWKEISERIRFERAENKCEWCGVANYAIGARDVEGNWHDEDSIHLMKSDEGWSLFGDEFPDMIKIVLTVAHHPDPDPMNCAEENLQALCQKCHNRLDAPMRAKNAAKTRRKKRIQAMLDNQDTQPLLPMFGAFFSEVQP